jgi:hypothetical protein
MQTGSSVLMPPDFDMVLHQYKGLWLDALDALAEKFPFAAACLACVCLDHLGNAIRQDAASTAEHATIYNGYIRKYLGASYQGEEAFPDDDPMRERFYAALRCGLVHEARTDDHRKSAAEAAPVWLSHEDFSPKRCNDWEDMYVSVPWLIRCVKRAWTDLSNTTDQAKRDRVAERLQMVIKEGTPKAPAPVLAQSRNADMNLLNSFATPPASASGSGFNLGPPVKSLDDRAHDAMLRDKYGFEIDI